MVSHDREFLNNVVTSTIVFEDGGVLEEYVGGYDDWLRQSAAPAPVVPVERAQKKEKRPQEKKKLSFKETKELEALPSMIEALEEEKLQLMHTLNSPDLYASRDLSVIQTANERWSAIENELDAAYHRWEELEQLQASLSGNKQAPVE
jgi:ATP-binding cassette subfamily F protein uup